MPIVNFKLYGSDNHKMWFSAMKIALKEKNKLGFIVGTSIKHVTSLVLSHEREICNVVVLGDFMVIVLRIIFG